MLRETRKPEDLSEVEQEIRKMLIRFLDRVHVEGKNKPLEEYPTYFYRMFVELYFKLLKEHYEREKSKG